MRSVFLRTYATRLYKTIALCYLTFPVLYVLASAILLNISLRNLLNILISPFYYFLSFWAVLTGYGFWEMRRWSWYLFMITNVMIVYQNANILINYSQSADKIIFFILSLLLLTIFTLLVSSEIRVPYFMPRIRWWERNTVFQLSVPVTILFHDGAVLEGNILDFSLKGCFVKLKDSAPLDEKITLGFRIFGQIIRCRGVVIWKTESTVTLPKGIGVKFFPMGRQNRKKVRLAAQRLEKVLKIYRRSEEGQETAFQKILDHLQSSKVEPAALRPHREVQKDVKLDPRQNERRRRTR